MEPNRCLALLTKKIKNTMEVNGVKVPLPTIHSNIFLCVQQKKETDRGLQQLEGE